MAAAALYRFNWFYPAFMIALGTHYLPFVFLYGMPMFYFLSGILIVAGVVIGQFLPDSFVLGGWFTAVVLLLFSGIGLLTFFREGKSAGPEQVTEPE